MFVKSGHVKSFTLGGQTNQVLVSNHEYGLFEVPEGFEPSMYINEHCITGNNKIFNAHIAEDGVLYIVPFTQIEAGDILRLHMVYI